MEALDRVEQSEHRDLLQGHYTDIEHELQAKTESLKKQRQKVWISLLLNHLNSKTFLLLWFHIL